MRLRSKLVEFDTIRQFGFTRHENYPHQKIFVHVNEMDGSQVSLGDELEYSVIDGTNGPKAVQITNVSKKVSVKVSGLEGFKISPPKKSTETPKPVETNVVRLNVHPVKENALHLYMPWNPGYINDQMFQLKDTISKTGRVWIPKINSTEGKIEFNKEIIQILSSQIEQGQETCLYMTNFQCIHIWKISKIHDSPTLPEEEMNSTLAAYATGGYAAEFWMQATDVYVLQADHDGKLTPILQELEKLSICNLESFTYDPKTKVTPYMSAQRYPAPVVHKTPINYFASVIKTRFAGQDAVETTETLWLNTHRKVTREYNLMQEHLKKNLYPGMWEKFNLRSQHFLTEMEMLKIESAGYASLQSLQFTKQIFECYVSAALNELDELVGEKVRQVTKGSNVVDLPFRKNKYEADSLDIIHGQGYGDYSADLPFYKAILNCTFWRSNVEALKLKIQKKSAHQDIDDILFLARSEVPTKLIDMTELRNWYSHGYFEVISQFMTGPKERQDELVAKLTTILNLLSSPHSAQNLFCEFYKVKTKRSDARGDVKMSNIIEEIRNYSKKAA